MEAGGEIGTFLKGWNKPVIRRADMVVDWSFVVVRRVDGVVSELWLSRVGCKRTREKVIGLGRDRVGVLNRLEWT
jgi:hypothetical protein